MIRILRYTFSTILAVILSGCYLSSGLCNYAMAHIGSTGNSAVDDNSIPDMPVIVSVEFSKGSTDNVRITWKDGETTAAESEKLYRIYWMYYQPGDPATQMSYSFMDIPVTEAKPDYSCNFSRNDIVSGFTLGDAVSLFSTYSLPLAFRVSVIVKGSESPLSDSFCPVQDYSAEFDNCTRILSYQWNMAKYNLIPVNADRYAIKINGQYVIWNTSPNAITGDKLEGSVIVPDNIGAGKISVEMEVTGFGSTQFKELEIPAPLLPSSLSLNTVEIDSQGNLKADWAVTGGSNVFYRFMGTATDGGDFSTLASGFEAGRTPVNLRISTERYFRLDAYCPDIPEFYKSSNVIFAKPEIIPEQLQEVIMPKAVTPLWNSPEAITVLKPVFNPDPGTDCELYIHDRYGAKVFEVKGRTNNVEWPVTVKGSRAQEGMYLYYLQYRTASGKTVKKTGSFLVLYP